MGKQLGIRWVGAAMAVGACMAPLQGAALVFGELQLRSYLGQPLRAMIPVRAGPGEQVDSSCFSLGRPPARSDAHLGYLTQAALALETLNGRTELKVSSAQPINDPYVKLLIQVNCGNGSYAREFTSLLDPAANTVDVSPLVVGSVSPATVGYGGQQADLTWQERQGETLQSIAAGRYPSQPGMQRRLVRAMRKSNPDLPAKANSPLPEGGVLNIPDLKVVPPAVTATFAALP